MGVLFNLPEIDISQTLPVPDLGRGDPAQPLQRAVVNAHLSVVRTNECCPSSTDSRWQERRTKPSDSTINLRIRFP